MSVRKHKSHQDHFDLLPFISILMCSLGCLLLVTVSVAAMSLGPAAGEGWIPSDRSGDSALAPLLIEWDGKTAIFHRGGQRIKATWKAGKRLVKLGGQWTSIGEGEAAGSSKGDFTKLLDELASDRATKYALFAVRPKGFDTFNAFADEFRDRDIVVGSEPIQGGKSVRLLPREEHK